jgi:hypothetical protein
MHFLKDSTYTNVKDAIINSTGEQGLISVWQKDEDSDPIFFINGSPFLTIKNQKKGIVENDTQTQI